MPLALSDLWASLSSRLWQSCFAFCSVVFSSALFHWFLQWLFIFSFVPISVAFSVCLILPLPCSGSAVLSPFSRCALPCLGPVFPSCHFFSPPSPHHLLAPLAALVFLCRPLPRPLCLLRLGHDLLSHPHLRPGLLWAQHHRLSRALALLPLPCFDFFSLTSVASRLSNGSPSTGTLALLTSTS